MKRAHLFEFNDLAGAPAFVRDTVVESLSRALEWGRMLEGVVAPFARFLDDAGTREVLDLGAGNGGPARVLAKAIARNAAESAPRFVLTDLHPRIEAWTRLRDEQPSAIDFVRDPVDATNIPRDLGEGRARTIINVLHHFTPDLAAAILEDAVRGSRGVFVVEGFERNPLMFANFALAGVPSLLVNPIASPRDRIAKALFTYATPLALAISIWDGLVSTMRVHTESELRAMVASFGAGWDWEYGRFAYPPKGTGYWFRGVPRTRSKA